MIPSVSHSPATPAAFDSVFDKVFDTIVCGAGLTGYATARTLAGQGRDVLLVEPSGDLLWECTRALENGTAVSAESAEWQRWISVLRERGGADEHFFEPALAEILTANELASQPRSPATLLYCSPVAVEAASGEITAVIVATKSGPRRLRARHWVDATERGQLTRLTQASVSPRAPRQVYLSLVLHSSRIEKIDTALPELAATHPGLEWFPSVRPEERRLRWPADDQAGAWHHKVPALVTDLRALVAAADEPALFVVSHCAMAGFPVYSAANNSHSSVPANLTVGSAALRNEPLATLADRFSFGVKLASEVPATSSAPIADVPVAAPALPPAHNSVEGTEVLVAGAGTGGAIAAISAARAGARTLVFDFTPYPGGIGTGAGICGYFHGAKGGLQDEIDLRVQAMTALLTGAPAGLNGWHHEAKKIVLLTLIEESGATFLGEVLLTGVERDASGRVLAALAVVEGQLTRLPASAFIDGTGDADLAAFAGAEFVTGRPGDGRTLSYSQSIFSLTRQEEKIGVRSCNFDAGWVDPTDPEDLSRARLIGIAQHLQPTWSNPDRAVAVSPLLGLRQSRQLQSDRNVTMVDLVTRARFDDSIGEVDTVADTHSVDFEFETDELAFYYWTCRGFRFTLRCELPYRMLLPRGLNNVWVACRAAGIEVDAAYGLRMQREMQRFGEVSGLAAALAVKSGHDARSIDLPTLQQGLDRSGCRAAERLDNAEPDAETLFAALDKGLPGVHLWQLYRRADLHLDGIRARLTSPSPRVSFYAAAILAMLHDESAEPRLIEAISAREQGPAPEEKPVVGAFGQCIDLPFWLQALTLLRRIGTARCLPVLNEVAAQPKNSLNVRTIVALTLEKIAARLGAKPELLGALDSLLADAIPDPLLPPSRSIWRALHDEPQKKLANDRGADVSQDHTWQLHLAIARTRKALGLPLLPAVDTFARDERGFVRQAFVEVGVG